MNKAFILILIACVIRVGSQVFWESIGNPMVYYGGVSLFDILMLYAILLMLENKRQKSIVNLFFGAAVYDAYNLFTNPFENDIAEHIGFIIAFIIWGVSQIIIMRKNGKLG